MGRFDQIAKLLGMATEDVAKMTPAEMKAKLLRVGSETVEDSKKLGNTVHVIPDFNERKLMKQLAEGGVKDSPALKLSGQAPVIDEVRAKQIAKAYDMMPHNPNDPEVQKSYDALINEVSKQYQALRNKGLEVSRIEPGMENPYKTSADLIKDVRENNRMAFFPTDQGFGSGSADTAGNPLLRPTEHELDGKPLLANDLFRIVHDYHGHVEPEMKFGARGEEGAWRRHMNMFSPEAQKALTTETRGQNSWVNFGPHGEANRANPANTVFADQKTGLLPEWAMNTAEEPGTPFVHYGEKGLNEAKGNLQDFAAHKNSLPPEGLEKYSGRIKGEVYDMSADPKKYLVKAKGRIASGLAEGTPEEVAKAIAKEEGYGGIATKSGENRVLESFEPAKIRPSYGIAGIPTVSMGLQDQLNTFKDQVAKPINKRWEQLKGMVYEPLSKQMNITKDPEQAKTIENTLKTVADPVNLLGGAAGLGAGAIQVLGEDDEDEKK